MLFGTRSKISGSSEIMVFDGIARKIDTKFGYTTWHPSGRLAVYSINKTRQFFHTLRAEVRDVPDLDSLLAYYLVDSEKVRTNTEFSQKGYLETYPSWSPDGKWLYFCRSPILWKDKEKLPPENYDQVKYDIVRISYDIETDTWGQLETIVSADQTGLSALEPRVSPDGKWLLFCMCNYGGFPVYSKSSDLYLIDLEAAAQTGDYKYRRLDINSDQSESWHSWSSNSRWIAFSSKRDYGVFTKTYLSYIDESGEAYNPVIMPQKDPRFYDSDLRTFSVPELITGPVTIRSEQLGRLVRGSDKIEVNPPITMATPKTPGAAWTESVWQERE